MGRPISQLNALTGAGAANGDMLAVLDVSDGIDPNKKITLEEYGRFLGSSGLGGGGDGAILSAAVANGSDQSVVIQAELAAAAARTLLQGRVLRLGPTPSGQIVIARPLVLSGEATGIVGSLYRTSVYSTFYGPTVCCRATRTMPTFGTGPFGGGSRAMLIGAGQWLNLGLHAPPLDVSALTTFTAELWIKRNANAGETLAILQSSLNLGAFYSKISWGLYESSGNRLRLYWNATSTVDGAGFYDSASSVLTTGAWQHVAMTFDGTTLRGFVGGVKVIDQAVGTGTVPQRAGCVEVTALGFHPADPTGLNWAAGAPDAYAHGIRISNTCRYTANFTPPASAFPYDAPVFVCNFDLRTTDTDFVSASTAGVWTYLVPQAAPETQQGRNVVRDITGRGFYFEDAITGTFENLESTENGFQFLGSCFENDCRDFLGLSLGYGIVLGSQCEGTSITGIKLSHQAIGLFASGSVGGNYAGVLTPQNKSLAAIVIQFTADCNFNHLQIDEEGQATTIQAAVVVRGGSVPTSVKFFGGSLGTTLAVPVLDVSGGASVQLYGTSYFTNVAAAEVVKVRDAPLVRCIAAGLTCYAGGSVPLTLSPAWVATLTNLATQSVADNGTLATNVLCGSGKSSTVQAIDATNNRSALYLLDNTTLTLISGHSQFSTVQGTGSKVNVYASGGKITLENKTGGALLLAAHEK